MAENDQGPPRRKVRGKGKLGYLRNLREGEKIDVEIFMDKPSGEGGTKLAHYIGYLAKDGHLLPLTVSNWRYMPAPKIEQVMNEIKHVFNYDEILEGTVRSKLNTAWKAHKAAMKTKGFKLERSMEENLANKPEDVLESQWARLVAMWIDPANQKVAAKNVENIRKQTVKHTGGSKPHTEYAKELKDKTGEIPVRLDVFKVTHLKNRGNPEEEEEMNPEAAELYHRMVEVQTLASQPESGIVLSGRTDAVSYVMGDDIKGRTRCFGNSMKPKNFWGDEPSSSSFSKLQTENARLKLQLLESQQEIQELKRQNEAYRNIMAGYNAFRTTDDPQPPFPNNEAGFDDFLNVAEEEDNED